MYQGAVVAMRKHVTCIMYSFPAWQRVANFHTRQAYSSTKELLQEQYNLFDGQATFCIKEMT